MIYTLFYFIVCGRESESKRKDREMVGIMFRGMLRSRTGVFVLLPPHPASQTKAELSSLTLDQLSL